MILTRAQKVRLGAFMLTGGVLIGGGIIILAGLQVWEKHHRYTVKFEENVSGLEVSAPVKYQGLRVGRVEDMYVSTGETSAIEVVLAIDPRTQLFAGTTAELDSSGLTGLKTVNLTPGDPSAERIEPGSELPAGKSLVERLTGKAEEIAVKVEIVANQLAQWTSDDNRRRVERLIESTDVLARQMNDFLKKNKDSFNNALVGVGRASNAFADAADDTKATLAEARTTLKAIRRPIEKIDPDEVAGAVTSTKQAMDSLNARLSEQEIGVAIANLQKALNQLTRLLQDVDLSVRSGREDFTATLSYLRQAAEDVREFSRIIAQDPSALIRGRE